jgi:4-hydroxy-2-oxoheptanedioate aldolase
MKASSGFTLARKLHGDNTVFAGWCGLPSPLVAELVGRDGFPAIVLDQQHGLWGTASLFTAIAAVHQASAAPIVRVPIGDFAMASRALDGGAEGIIAPMINSADDAYAFVAATKFPPVGERSWGPQRAMTFSGLTDSNSYLRKANELTVTFAMIETRRALDNLDAILATPGIDGVFVGPFDLSITLANGKTVDPDSKDVDAALNKILKAADKADKLAGVYCHTAKRARTLAKRGFRFITAGSDTSFLRAGVSAVLEELKDVN